MKLPKMPVPKTTHPLQVDFQLVVNGQDVSKTLNNRLTSLSLTDNAGQEADSLSFTLSDHDGKLEVPSHKAEIKLSLGTKETGLVDKGVFFVDESGYSSPPNEISIVARSAAFKPEFLQGRASRSWDRKTLADIVGDIAKLNQLEPMISQQLAGIRRVSTHQTDETDYNFLSRLAKDNDAHINVKGDILYFVKQGGFNSQDEGLPSVSLDAEDISSHSYQSQDREAYSGVRAHWNDVAYGIKKEVIAGDSNNLTTLRNTYASADDAKAAAYAELAKIKRGQFSLTLNLNRPRLDIIAGQPLNVTGLKQPISEQDWIIKTVEHSFNGSSPFLTRIEAEARLDSDAQG